MKTILGYILIVLGSIGFLFFKNYHGESISFPFFWMLTSILVALFGGYLAFSKIKNETNSEADEKILRLRLHGEQIKVDFDYCLFKTNNFQQEVISEFPSGTQLYDGLYDAGRANKSEDKKQTVIIYNRPIGDRSEEFVSQIFPIDELVLKFHVTNGDVLLYVDRSNRSNYFFDILR